MFAWFWLISSALAADCAPTAQEVERAWAAFDDAELEGAKTILSQAYTGLSCQTELVPTSSLLDLYRLDALVSLTKDDSKGATYATIRAVTAAPDEPPNDSYGPELQEMFATWHSRLNSATVTFQISDDYTVFLDGRPVDAGSTVTLLEGEHLIQVPGADGLASQVLEITAPSEWRDGGVHEVEVEVAVPTPEEEPPAKSGKRKRPALLWGSGLVLGGLGAGSLTWAYTTEQSFNQAPFNAPTYGDCSLGDDCYAQAREDEIDRWALQIRAAYGAGYGLAAVGTALVGAGIIGVPVSGDGRVIRIHGRF